MAVEVFVADEQTDFPVENLRWLKLAEKILDAEGVRGDAELSILFVDEKAMSDLNARFNSKEGPTDVLAFPIDEEPTEGGRSPDSGGSGPGYTPPEPSDLPTLLGDVVICPSVASRNAPEHAGSYDDEVALLIVHGILHLMGMDHDEDDEAELMEARERELLSRFYAPAALGDAAGEAGLGKADAPGSVPPVAGGAGSGGAGSGGAGAAGSLPAP